jgi:hypothetical protein
MLSTTAEQREKCYALFSFFLFYLYIFCSGCMLTENENDFALPRLRFLSRQHFHEIEHSKNLLCRTNVYIYYKMCFSTAAALVCYVIHFLHSSFCSTSKDSQFSSFRSSEQRMLPKKYRIKIQHTMNECALRVLFSSNTTERDDDFDFFILFHCILLVLAHSVLVISSNIKFIMPMVLCYRVSPARRSFMLSQLSYIHLVSSVCEFVSFTEFKGKCTQKRTKFVSFVFSLFSDIST